MSHAEQCPVCKSSGKYEEKECHGCAGKGWVTISDNKDISIPYIPYIPYEPYPYQPWNNPYYTSNDGITYPTEEIKSPEQEVTYIYPQITGFSNEICGTHSMGDGL